VRVDAGADSSAAGRASVEARQAADCPVSCQATQHSTPPLPKASAGLRGRCPKRPPVAGQHLSCASIFDDGRPSDAAWPGKSALMPQTNCSASLAGKNAQKPKSSGSVLATTSTRCGYGEFEFKGYQLMMEHNYFINTNWEALEMAQPPRDSGSHTASSWQGYNREPTPSKSRPPILVTTLTDGRFLLHQQVLACCTACSASELTGVTNRDTH
uniref:BTB domain-containing protein n=1 Tax=Macrostomum lignano TaxID=282301 RepID=A0A1I8FJZ8_9PLAT